MSPQEFESCRVVAGIYRKQRREIERLKAALGMRQQEEQQFDRENEDVFALVRMNRQRFA